MGHIVSLLSSVSYINKRHDPESIAHNGLLLSFMGQLALSYVVLCNRTVSQRVPEMMHDLCGILCVIPAARLREERICNQWAHQGPEADEKMKSLQNVDKDRGLV